MINNKIKLTLAQKSFLDLEYLFPNMCTNNLHTMLFLKVSTEEIQKAHKIVVEENDIFNLRLGYQNDEYFLYEAPMCYEELSVFDFSNRQLEYVKWKNEHQNRQLFFADSPLYFFSIVVLPDGRHGLSFLTHHMMHDAYSICLFFKKFLDVLVDTREDTRRYSYIDYMFRENGKSYELSEDYWVKKINAYKDNTLFEPGSNELLGNTYDFIVPPHISCNIREYSAKNSVSIFVLILSGILLCRSIYTNSTNLEVGVPILNRIGHRDKNTLGLYTTVLPLFILFDLNVSIKKYLLMLRDNVDELFRYRNSSYEEIKLLYKEIKKTPPNLYDMLLSYQNLNHMPDGINLEWIQRKKLVNPLLITILDQESTPFIIRCEYRREMVSTEFIKNLISDFEVIMSGIINADQEEKLGNILEICTSKGEI